MSTPSDSDDPVDPNDLRDPRNLRVDDRVRFIRLPEEWDAPEYQVHDESIAFMRALIARGRSSRIARIDAWGYPWIDARFREPDGEVVYHSWMIAERTGWRRVRPRRATP